MELISSLPLAAKVGITVSPVILYLLKSHFEGGVNVHNPNLDGKVVIITGSNTGIGYQTALKLAQLKANVILACRDTKRGKDAENSLRLQTNSDKLEFMQLDLCDFESVRQFVKNYKNKYDRLDYLVNNAGIMMPQEKQLTKDGLELQMQSNHYGHFLLTSLLIDYLLKSDDARIVNVSSMAHLWANNIDLDNLNGDKSYDPKTQYGLTKICNIFFAQQLSKRYPSIKSVSLHPGVVRTELSRHIEQIPWIRYLRIPMAILIGPIYYLMSKSSRGGAQTSLHCCCVDREALENGAYYADCVIKRTPQQNQQKESDYIWKHSQQVTNSQWL